jgi:hypothetical protein
VKTRQKITLVLLIVLVAASVGVAYLTPAPDKLPAAAWNSSWVFAAEVFVGFFVVTYVLLAIVIFTVVEGKPPDKLSFGLLSYENEIKKTVEALSEGGTALQAVETEVRNLQEGLNAGLSGARAALENVIRVADALPDEKGMGVAAQAKSQLAELPAATPELAARSEFTVAMARFDQLVSQLDALSSRRGG